MIRRRRFFTAFPFVKLFPLLDITDPRGKLACALIQ